MNRLSPPLPQEAGIGKKTNSSERNGDRGGSSLQMPPFFSFLRDEFGKNYCNVTVISLIPRAPVAVSHNI